MIIVYLLLILFFTLCMTWSILFVKYLKLKCQFKKDAYVMFNNPNPSELDYVGYTMGKYMIAYHTFPWNKKGLNDTTNEMNSCGRYRLKGRSVFYQSKTNCS